MNGTGNILDMEAHVNGNEKKDLENNQYDQEQKVSNDDDVIDPDILAAIAASKQDIDVEEADPAVLAAIEASKQEVEQEKAKNERKGPILMFSTLGRNDSEDPDDPDEVDQDDVDKEDVDPGDLDPEDNVKPTDVDDNKDNETTKEVEVPDSDSRITRAKNEEKLTPTLRRAYITKVKPEKRYCSSDDDSHDSDWGGGKKKKKKAPPKKASTAGSKKAPVVATGPSSLFKCPNCALTVETIGQMNVHKHADHGESKPSVLDMGEAIIARLQDKGGSPKDKILKEIQTEFGDMVENKDKVGNLLGIALVEGIEFGRLRQGTSGKKNWNNYWLQENAKKRKTMMDKWLTDPATVGDTSSSGGEVTVNIIENSAEFIGIKEKLEKYNIQVTTAVRKPDPPKSKSKKKKGKGNSDDEIEIVSEKISEKTKLKLLRRKKLQNMKPKAVIKVNSPQGKQMLKTIAKTGKVPFNISSSSSTSSASKTTSKLVESSFGNDDDEDDDDGLSCPTCFSSFWYPSQTFEHMKSVHNIENPEKYIKEKKRSRT